MPREYTVCSGKRTAAARSEEGIVGMRATEALHLSNPANSENDRDRCTHLDVERHREDIKLARRENRRPKSLFE